MRKHVLFHNLTARRKKGVNYSSGPVWGVGPTQGRRGRQAGPARRWYSHLEGPSLLVSGCVWPIPVMFQRF